MRTDATNLHTVASGSGLTKSRDIFKKAMLQWVFFICEYIENAYNRTAFWWIIISRMKWRTSMPFVVFDKLAEFLFGMPNKNQPTIDTCMQSHGTIFWCIIISQMKWTTSTPFFLFIFFISFTHIQTIDIRPLTLILIKSSAHCSVLSVEFFQKIQAPWKKLLLPLTIQQYLKHTENRCMKMRISNFIMVQFTQINILFVFFLRKKSSTWWTNTFQSPKERFLWMPLSESSLSAHSSNCSLYMYVFVTK